MHCTPQNLISLRVTCHNGKTRCLIFIGGIIYRTLSLWRAQRLDIQENPSFWVYLNWQGFQAYAITEHLYCFLVSSALVASYPSTHILAVDFNTLHKEVYQIPINYPFLEHKWQSHSSRFWVESSSPCSPTFSVSTLEVLQAILQLGSWLWSLWPFSQCVLQQLFHIYRTYSCMNLLDVTKGCPNRWEKYKGAFQPNEKKRKPQQSYGPVTAPELWKGRENTVA